MWREHIRTLVRLHNEKGVGASRDLDHVRARREERLMTVTGPTLSIRKVAKWVWSERQTAQVSDGLWSVYDREDDVSFVGFYGEHAP